ncbi:MAG TPA: tetratricopeptide repeat protein, partial [Pirellulales bacterium]|nr:tetratricopeptide repeat protein [Pirellulales bacterium]
MAEDTKGRQPIPPGKRRMLQQCFEAGSSKSASGNFDYAAQMFTQCVVGDPANLLYAQNFLANLQKKYNNNKSGAALAAMRSAKSKGGVTYASKRKDWLGVIASGLEVLKLNPWDTGALAEMANACAQLQFEECQIVWLKGALEADIKDPEVNRLLGRALAKQGQFDQAIACWMRVQQAKPNDEEAHRAIANLQVEKTIHKGGYEDAESSTEVMADKQAMADRQGTGGQRLSPEQQLEKRIVKDPSNISLYLELADLRVKQEQFTPAEAVLKRGLEASGGSLEVREYLEDVELRHARHQVLIAEKRAKS